MECRDTQSCIYEEEEQSITVHLHVIQQHKYENYTLAFMLREISKYFQLKLFSLTKGYRAVTLNGGFGCYSVAHLALGWQGLGLYFVIYVSERN